MNEVDKGMCGECIYFRSNSGIDRRLTDEGYCSNPYYPLLGEVKSTMSPREALLRSGLEGIVFVFQKYNLTCFEPKRGTEEQADASRG